MKKVLVVYNSSSIVSDLTSTLVMAGFEISMISIDGDVQAILNSESYTLLVIDVDYPEGNFTRLLSDIRKISGYLFTPIILLSEKSKTHCHGEYLFAGYIDYLQKPFHPEQFHAALAMTSIEGQIGLPG